MFLLHYLPYYHGRHVCIKNKESDPLGSFKIMWVIFKEERA